MRKQLDTIIKKEDPENNVCLFSREQENSNFLFPYQFVYETLPGILAFPVTPAHYACHLVVEGSAFLKTEHGTFPLKKGDIFFVFPAVSYTLLNCSQCKYLYISFIGAGIDELFRPYGINRRNPVFSGCDDLIDFWISSLGKCTVDNLPMLTKGILYYTLAVLPVHAVKPEDSHTNVIDRIRSVIDQCYPTADLSLESICRLYNYNPKYISRRFRETVGVSFTDYLENCRIRRACVLLSETDSMVQEIALAVGYRDTSYFSKVFRKCMGVSPSAYREKGK